MLGLADEKYDRTPHLRIRNPGYTDELYTSLCLSWCRYVCRGLPGPLRNIHLPFMSLFWHTVVTFTCELAQPTQFHASYA